MIQRTRLRPAQVSTVLTIPALAGLSWLIVGLLIGLAVPDLALWRAGH